MPSREAILLSAKDGQKQVVGAACARATAAGVRVGMPLGQARALFAVDAARVEEMRPEKDRAALRSLAVWASQRFSPLVAVDGEDGLLLDVTGCEWVFKGEQRLLEMVMEALRRLGLCARVAIAPSFGCAWAAARHSQGSVVPEGGARRAMGPLPVAALRIDAAMRAGLAEVGIERVEEVMRLPRGAVPARFGDGLLLRLDQALGQAIELIEPVRDPAPPCVRRVFDGPTVQLEAVERTARELLDELSEELLTRESGARGIGVELVRADDEAVSLAVCLGRPCRDSRHLWALLRPKLERVNMGFGVEEVVVRAARTERLRHEQVERWRDESIEAGRTAGECVDTLANRLGPERVLGATLVESHVPERAFGMGAVEEGKRHRGEETQRWSADMVGDRPPVLFERAWPVEVLCLTPDGPVMSVRWQGRERKVVTTIGPERIGPEWWRGDRMARDYFKVQDEMGRWLWVYREVEGTRWFVQGGW